jgi:outer membrane protein OmpA-like peptidoglycan-associated protein
MALAGCQAAQENPRTAGGALAGAAAGAALGTLAGGDDRRNALIGAGIGLLAGGAVGNYLDRQQAALERDLAGTGAEVTREGDALRVRMPSSITFATDSTRIRPEFRPVLADLSRTLNSDPRSFVNVEGHTDSTGSESYNEELSRRRANAVAEVLRANGVAPERIATYGMGESAPVATNATAEGRQRNRRVEITVIPATRPS